MLFKSRVPVKSREYGIYFFSRAGTDKRESSSYACDLRRKMRNMHHSNMHSYSSSFDLGIHLVVVAVRRQRSGMLSHSCSQKTSRYSCSTSILRGFPCLEKAGLVRQHVADRGSTQVTSLLFSNILATLIRKIPRAKSQSVRIR